MDQRAGRFGVLVALIASLAACGGGGGGGSGSGPELKAGVTVDPYVVGAVLEERTPAGAVVQESSASDAKGAFAFSKGLTAGNRVVTSVKGLHNGKPYAVALSAVVDSSRTAVVVSPLTTLVASGAFTADNVAALVNTALPGDALAAADMLDDPMARVLDGTVTASDRRLLAANIAVGAALVITHGNAASADLPALVAAIAPKVLAALSLDGAPAALASAAAAVADYVTAVSTTPAEATKAADAVSSGLLTQLVGNAAGGGCAAIVVSGGSLQAGTSATTVAAHLTAGKAALQSFSSTRATDTGLAALGEFSAAAALADADATATANEKQQAYFYGGLARLLALAQPYSNATDDGLNDVGDLLDAYGLGGTNTERKNLDTLSFVECHDLLEPNTTTVIGQSCGLKQIPSTAPRTRALQAFVAGKVANGLRAAVASLGKVADDFTTTLDVGGRTVELDAADAQLAKAVGQAMLAATELQYAYDLDVKLDDLQSRFGEEASSGGGSAGPGPVPVNGVRSLARLVTAPVRALAASEADSEGPAQLLADYPKLLTLLDASALQNVRSDAQAACATALHALDLLAAEKDDQSDDFFRIGGGERCAYDQAAQDVVCTPIDVAAEIASMRAEIEQVQKVLATHGNYTFDMGTADTKDDVTIAPDKFFAGIDLRKLLPTSWDKGASGSAPGLFPDATLGGFLVSAPFSLNADLDQDGSPDLFGYSYLVPSQIAGRTFWSGSYWPGAVAGTWTFDAGGKSFSFHGQVYGSGIVNDGVELAGTYTVAKNVLTLDFAQSDATRIAHLILTADDIESDWFGGQARYLDADGATLMTVYQDFSPYNVGSLL